MGEATVRRRVQIRGRVQGVGFRAETRNEARRVGVQGWVRNRPDGTVEAVFEGEPAAVQRMIAFCQRGPSWSRVDEAQVGEEPAQGLSGFEIR